MGTVIVVTCPLGLLQRMSEERKMSTDKFFAFLEPAEESALLAAAPEKTFQRGDVVLDQNVTLRAIFVIDRGSVQVERAERAKMVPLEILARRTLRGDVIY